MNDPLFKSSDAPITPEEEMQIIQRLAEAYRQQEEVEKKPELQRIAQRVAVKLADGFKDTPFGE